MFMLMLYFDSDSEVYFEFFYFFCLEIKRFFITLSLVLFVLALLLPPTK